MREVVLVASKSIIQVVNKPHEVVVTNRLVEIVINPPTERPPQVIFGLQVDLVVLSEVEILAGKAFTTAAQSGGIILDVIGGCTQYENFDYTVGEGYVEWKGLGLEELLEAGDILRLAYIPMG